MGQLPTRAAGAALGFKIVCRLGNRTGTAPSWMVSAHMHTLVRVRAHTQPSQPISHFHKHALSHLIGFFLLAQLVLEHVERFLEWLQQAGRDSGMLEEWVTDLDFGVHFCSLTFRQLPLSLTLMRDYKCTDRERECLAGRS
jgi:hypothetical protein